MSQRVLILGGSGRIGSSVATDVIAHTDAQVTITGRTASGGEAAMARLGNSVKFLALDLDDAAALKAAMTGCDLVIHCAGPFNYRNAQTLQTCIELSVNYLDVSDQRTFTQKALTYRAAAQQAGITAILNSGIFPGISNSMVRQGVEQLDHAEQIHLSYIVAGSGGAGLTVMRTTFLGLQKPFQAWLNGQWQAIAPYSARETVEFPQPYGPAAVYWFDMPEAFTLVEAFPQMKTVVTKFGSLPDYYNHLTWIAAHWFPKALMRQPAMIEFLAHVSHRMTKVSDRFSGIGVAIRAEVQGTKNDQPQRYISTLVHENTAIAAGYGTGSLAELLLVGKLQKPGVWTVEEALPTELFEWAMENRGLPIHHQMI